MIERLEPPTDNASPACWAWAKSRVDVTTGELRWLPLWRHLADSELVAGYLWNTWVPHLVRDRLAAACGSPERAEQLFRFLAAVHDVGKASVPFAAQVPALAQLVVERGLPAPVPLPPQERARYRHEVVGEIAVEHWLTGRGVDRGVARTVGVVVGSHHGRVPTTEQLRDVRDRHDVLGGDPWGQVREVLVQDAAARSGVVAWTPQDWAVPVAQWAQVLLAGMVVVADWMASSEALFPLEPAGLQPAESDDARLRWAMERLDLPAAWRVDPPAGSVAERLRSRFSLPVDATPRDVQAVTVAAAEAMDCPGLLIVEAEMGSGKTEAGLLAAEVLAARVGAGGYIVLLPTQATTNAMFTRVLRWLRETPVGIGSPDGQDEATGRRSVQLAHGKALLNPALRELVTGPRVAGVGIDTEDGEPPTAGRPSGQEASASERVDPVVHSWLAGPRKRLLADVVVATFDQLLLGGLRARHVALRHLALAGKVVVIDEVHAHDVFMSRFLERVLEWLGAYGTPVVMLSATLATGQRRELAAAYQRGRAASAAPAPITAANVPGIQGRRRPGAGQDLPAAGQSDAVPSPTAQPVYPVVSFLEAGELVARSASPSTGQKRVLLELLDEGTDEADGDERIAALLQERLATGGCALVVRNTVRAAQRTARRLGQLWPQQVTLTHSRFTAARRAELDADLLRRFGPPSGNGAGRRPELAIVVGTQVTEQSLDVDFDLLVSDLAPIDLLLQRIGRLHRHNTNQQRPSPLRQPRCVVAGVGDWTGQPPDPDQGSLRVYRAHPLLRAAAIITQIAADNSGLIQLPDDIARLVERAYSDQLLGPSGWQPAMHAARTQYLRAEGDRRSRAETATVNPPNRNGKPIVDFLRGSLQDPERDTNTPTGVRDGEDAFEVLLLQSGPDGTVWLPGEDRSAEPIPMDAAPSDTEAERILGASVRLPGWVCQGPPGDALLTALESRTYVAAWQRHPLLRGQLVLLLDDGGKAALSAAKGLDGQWHFTYDSWTGLEVSRDHRNNT